MKFQELFKIWCMVVPQSVLFRFFHNNVNNWLSGYFGPFPATKRVKPDITQTTRNDRIENLINLISQVIASDKYFQNVWVTTATSYLFTKGNILLEDSTSKILQYLQIQWPSVISLPWNLKDFTLKNLLILPTKTFLNLHHF